MPRKSTIRSLPPDKLEKLQTLLRDPRWGQLEIVAEINALLEQGGHEERITKSSLNRYKLSMDKVGERMQQSREVAEMWISKLGAQPQGQVGHLLNEMMRTLSFDLMLHLQQDSVDEESLPGFVEALKGLSLTLMRLEKAAGDNVKRESDIRKQAKEEAAEQVGKSLENRGLSAATVTDIKREVLGLA